MPLHHTRYTLPTLKDKKTFMHAKHALCSGGGDGEIRCKGHAGVWEAVRQLGVSSLLGIPTWKSPVWSSDPTGQPAEGG